MSETTQALLQWALWCGAFWTVVFLTRHRISEPADAWRLVAGLALGAVAAHLGTALTSPQGVAGFSVLFVPLGLLAAGLATGGRAERWRFLELALPALPLAFGVARVGCLVAGCCAGSATSVPWAIESPAGPGVHPVAAYEIALLLGLHGLLRAAPLRRRAALALGGIGAIRMAVEPFRAPPDPEPLLAAGWVAFAWMLVAVAMLICRRGFAYRLPTSRSSSSA